MTAKRFWGAFGALLAAAALAMAMAIPALAYEQRTEIVANGHGANQAKYLVIHETANPGASAYNHVKYWSNNPAYAVHYVMQVDGSVVYQTMHDDRLAWHVGNGNRYTVGIELCHAISQTQFDSQWNEAVKWAGDYLKSRGWGIDRLLSHDECRRMWGGTDHTDPNAYFEQYGKSWAAFEQAVSEYLGGAYVPTGGQTTTGPEPTYTEHEGSGFGGKYTVNCSTLNIRKGPGTGYASVGHYSRGGTVILDDWYVINGGYVWGKYTAYSGNTRYIAVGKATGKPEANDYLVKGGAASKPAATSRKAGWYEVDVNTRLNVRTGPGTGYKITGSLRDGYDLYVSGWSGDWARYTTYSGATRYVHGDYLAA